MLFLLSFCYSFHLAILMDIQASTKPLIYWLNLIGEKNKLTSTKIFYLLFIILFTAAVSIEMFTQPWPVRKGLNIISCLEFEKAKELNKKVCSVAYNKYEPDGIRYNFVVGVNLCSNSTDMTNSVQWNERMLMSGKYEMYEGTWFIGIHVVEEDNKTKYFCHALGPEYRGAIQIQLIYAEGKKPSYILVVM